VSFELDLGMAERLLASLHPAGRAHAVARIPGGRNNSVFEVQMAKGAVVVKVYPGDWGWMMKKEALAIGVLHDQALHLPIPHLLAADDSGTILPEAFLVASKLPGRHLGAHLPDVDEETLAAFNRQAGGLLRALHEVHFDAFGYLGTNGIVQGHPTNLDYMRFQFDKKLREFDSLGGDPDLRRAIERHVADRGDLFAWPHACYCHNDCHEGNVLMEAALSGWAISGLLDFENVVAGDPLLDLAKTHYYARRRTERTLAALAEGHGDLRDNWRPALTLYVLYHALELWAWTASLGQSEPLSRISEDIRRLIAGEPLPPVGV
jgi:hygromycin-B 7''-O-kinase